MECVLEVRPDLAAAVLAVRGEVDVDTAPELEAALTLLLRSGVDHLTVDVAGVTFIDSSGLYVLARAGRQAREKVGLVVRNPGPHVGKVLSLSGLERVLTIAHREEAPTPVPVGAHDGDVDDDTVGEQGGNIIRLR